MPYDLFISYSRKDNENNRVIDLIEIIKHDYLEFSKEELNCFFDTEEIKVMEDWEHKLLQGLRDSHLLLIILTPNYLSSPNCEWEIIEYLKYEYSRGVAGDGVTQVYFLEIPGIDTDSFKEKAAQWLNKLGSRQRIDFRPWNEERSESLKNLEVKKRLKELRESLRKRIVRKRVISNVEGNLPAPNLKFVGRETEMKNLHKCLDTGRLGVITAVHGVGGLGKTAIAFQYAWAFGDFYPGGAWYISCANQKNLATVLKSLSSDLNIIFSDEEQKDEIKGAKRILNALKTRAEKGAKKSNENIKPSVLLILDNVDFSELIEPPEVDLISGKEWLKVLVTTRMGPKELHTDGTEISLLTIDELPFDDALSLIESYQKNGKFANKTEKEKAEEIVELLGGFTLAIEVAALYLKQMDGRCSCADFLELLKKEGIEEIGSLTKKNLSHSKLISVTLKPTLESLTLNEFAILEYASLLPPDSIPLPWLKALTEKDYPEFAKEDEIGKDNPWISAINHLLSIRLFKVVEMDDKGKNPRIVKMHRLVQEEIGRRMGAKDKKQDRIVSYIQERANYFLKGLIYKEDRWEVNTVNITTLFWMNENLLITKHLGDIVVITNFICYSLRVVGKFNEAIILLQQLIKLEDKFYQSKHIFHAKTYTSLAAIEIALGNFNNAQNLLKHSIEIEEKVYTPEHLELAKSYSNLAIVELNLNNLIEAKRLLKHSIEIEEKISPTDTNLAITCSHLGVVEQRLGNFLKAKLLLMRAIEIELNHYTKDHPALAIRYSNLALIENDLGNFKEAKILVEKAIEIDKTFFAHDHPEFAIRYSNFSIIEINLGNFREAKNHLTKALEIQKKNFQPDHPNFAVIFSNLCLAEKELGNFKEAKSHILKAIEIQKKNFQTDHPSIAVSFSNLAMVEKELGNFKEAKNHILKAIEIQKKNFIPDHPSIAVYFSNLAMVEKELGNFKEAKSHLLKAIEIQKKNFQTDFAMVEKELGNFKEAKSHLLKAIEIQEKNFQTDHPSIAVYFSNLAMVEKDLGNFKEAKESLDQSNQIILKVYESQHPKFANNYFILATIEDELGNLNKSRKLLKLAIDIAEKKYETGHPKLLEFYSKLESIEKKLK